MLTPGSMEVFRMSELPCELDWRDQVECEECRAWAGESPPSVRDVEEPILGNFPELVALEAYRVFYACLVCEGYLDPQERSKAPHMPITIVDVPGSRFQFLPERG